MSYTIESVKEWLKPIEDPEMLLSLVELGLVYDVMFPAEDAVNVTMTLTSPACPAAGYIVQKVKERLLELEGIKTAEVKLVFEPKWDPKTMASEDCKEALGLW